MIGVYKMKIVAWEELMEYTTPVVYTLLQYLIEGEKETLMLLYPDPCRLIDEDFPVQTPEGGGCYHDAVSNFVKTKRGDVRDLDTTGDVKSIYKPEEKVVVYEKNDLLIWQKTLTYLIERAL